MLLNIPIKTEYPIPILSNLLAWYDFSSANYLSLSSTAIIQAFDRSGNGNDTIVQATGTKRPTWTASQLNGLPAAVFDGGDTLALPAAVYAAPLGNTTTFVVSKISSETAARQQTISMSAAGAKRFSQEYSSTAGSREYQSRNAAGSPVISTGNTNTIYRISTGQRSSTTQYISVSGATPVTDANGDNATCDAGFIGSLADTSQYLTGGIAEIIIYNRALSASEITYVSLYLANKWGVYYPNAAYISNLSYPYNQPMYISLINAFTINKDNAFTNTTANPIACIYDAETTSLGSVTSWTDNGGKGNTATGATAPVNTANAVGTRNGVVWSYNELLTVAANSTINDIFATGGTDIYIMKLINSGGDVGLTNFTGRYTNKNSNFLFNSNTTGSACKITSNVPFSTTTGQFISTNTIIDFNTPTIFAYSYNGSSTANAPAMYVNSATAKPVTTSVAPVGTISSDSATVMNLCNITGGGRGQNGAIAMIIRVKGVAATAAQITTIFNAAASNNYGITLS